MIIAMRKKIGLLGRDENGQSMVFVALTLLMMFLFVCVTVDVGDFVAQKVEAQNAADALAVSMAVWQARGLNQIQTLNIAKNLAHMHYMLEFAEVVYWAVQVISGNLAALVPLYESVGDPLFCWVFGWCPDESLPDEMDTLEGQLGRLTRIQSFISGVGTNGDDNAELGSVEMAMGAALYMVENANGGGLDSILANAALGSWEIGGFPGLGLGLYDPDLKIDFQRRATFFTIFTYIFDLLGVDIGDLHDVLDFLDWASTIFEVNFDWAVQTNDYLDDQFVVAVAVRDATSPMFGGKFQPKTLVGALFGGLGISGQSHLAIAQAKPFKPEDYVIRPRALTNGLAADLLGLPFDLSILIGGNPSQHVSAIWDVKLTPVTVLDRFGLGGISSLAMTH